MPPPLSIKLYFFFNHSEISGPIILDMYRVIADYTKTTKYEINLLAGDQVEIVEKNQNGEAEHLDPEVLHI